VATRIVNDPKAREKPCLRCGYSLRKLPDARHCPECGLSVWLSLSEADLLALSNPLWLRRLAIACGLIAAAHALSLALWAAVRFFNLARVIRVHFGVATFLLASVSLGVCLIVFHAGMLLLAAPEHRHPDRLKVYRRWLVVLGTAGLAMGILLAVTAFVRVVAWPSYVLMYYLWDWGAGLVVLGGVVATLAYLRKLAGRAPSSRAAKFCGAMMIAPAVMAWPALPCLGPGLFFGAAEFIRVLPWIYLSAMFALSAWFAIMFHRNAVAAQREWTAETAAQPH
jgi:hypothetical protein